LPVNRRLKSSRSTWHRSRNIQIRQPQT